MIIHSTNECCDALMHSMNNAVEFTANLIANAAPMMPTQYIGSFHFMNINSYHPIIPQWYTQVTADAINTTTSATCISIFVVSILASL